MSTVTFHAGASGVELRWPDGTSSFLPYIWLRHNAPSAFHPETRERTFDITEVELDERPAEIGLTDDTLTIRWVDGGAPETISLDWLREHGPGARRRDAAEIAPQLWRGDLTGDGIPRFDARALMTDDTVLQTWLVETVRYGVSIVENLSGDLADGVTVAERVGFLRETNFGRFFEVMSKPDPNNLAYTASALLLHTDLPNLELAPGYQFLACLANEAEGGDSRFADGFAVVEDLRASDPESFELLTTVRVPFRFHDDTCDLRGRSPVVELDGDGNLQELRISSHILDIVDLDAELSVRFYRAFQKLMRLIRGPDYVIGARLRRGEMVVFDNRRVLHGRSAFNPSTGFRHLKGFYVDRGEVLSRIRVLARAAEDSLPERPEAAA